MVTVIKSRTPFSSRTALRVALIWAVAAIAVEFMYSVVRYGYVITALCIITSVLAYHSLQSFEEDFKALLRDNLLKNSSTVVANQLVDSFEVASSLTSDLFALALGAFTVYAMSRAKVYPVLTPYGVFLSVSVTVATYLCVTSTLNYFALVDFLSECDTLVIEELGVDYYSPANTKWYVKLFVLIQESNSKVLMLFTFYLALYYYLLKFTASSDFIRELRIGNSYLITWVFLAGFTFVVYPVYSLMQDYWVRKTTASLKIKAVELYKNRVEDAAPMEVQSILNSSSYPVYRSRINYAAFLVVIFAATISVAELL